MALADDLIGDIAQVLDDADYGRDVTIRHMVSGVYDPATGVSAAPTKQDTATRGIIIGYSDRTINSSSGTIIRGDRRVILKVKDLTIEPEISDQVIAGASVYAIVDRRRIELGGTTIVWILQVRGLSR